MTTNPALAATIVLGVAVTIIAIVIVVVNVLIWINEKLEGLERKYPTPVLAGKLLSFLGMMWLLVFALFFFDR